MSSYGTLYMREIRKTQEYKDQYKIWWDSYIKTPSGWATRTVNRLKSKAKKKKIEFDLVKEDLSPPEFCPVLGIKLILDKNEGNDFNPSVDRIDNTKGYIKNNVRVISGRANRIKSDASADELIKILNYMESQ